MPDPRPTSTLSLVLGQAGPAPAPIPRFAVGDVLAGRYALEAELGAGAVGTVWRARHTALGTRHAVKVVAAPSPVITERLLREGRVQASLAHPNVVRVTDVLTEGVTALVLELVGGPTLAERLARGRPPWPEVLDLARDVIRGVRAAHAVGIVHRDLKPANVLLAEGPDGRAIARVTDFGLAHSASDPGLTTEGAVLGTPAYMAPEQLVDPRSVDARADVWALGALLYELATGQRPFPGSSLTEVAGQVALGRYRPPRAHAPDLPAGLEAAIAGALVVDRDRRLPDCDALLAALDGPPPAPRTPRRIAAAGAAALGLALLAFVAWSGPLATPPDPVPGAVPAAEPPAAEAAPEPTPRPPAPAPDPAPTPPAPGPAPPTPRAKRPPEPAPVTAPAPADAAPVVAAPAPEPPGRVTLGGEFRPPVELRGPGGSRAPGEVPVGRWHVWADFGAGFTDQGPIDVAPRAELEILCHSMKRTCAAR